MAKKSSASSRRGKQIRVSAESIWNKPLTELQKAALDSVAKRQKRADVSQLDYSDIPKQTAPVQWTRPGALVSAENKQQVTLRLDGRIASPSMRFIRFRKITGSMASACAWKF